MSGTTVEKIESELSELGMDDLIGEQPEPGPGLEPDETEPDIPPEDQGEPVGAGDPQDEPPQTDRERVAKSTQALARALDQLHVHFAEARSAAHELCAAINETLTPVPEAAPESAPAPAEPKDDEQSTDEGEENGDTSVPKEE